MGPTQSSHTVLVDGYHVNLQGVEATAASKRMATLLAAKWKRSALALVRDASHCLRGAHDPTACLATMATWESGVLGLYLYR
jgi:hypothetical protein